MAMASAETGARIRAFMKAALPRVQAQVKKEEDGRSNTEGQYGMLKDLVVRTDLNGKFGLIGPTKAGRTAILLTTGETVRVKPTNWVVLVIPQGGKLIEELVDKSGAATLATRLEDNRSLADCVSRQGPTAAMNSCNLTFQVNIETSMVSLAFSTTHTQSPSLLLFTILTSAFTLSDRQE